MVAAARPANSMTVAAEDDTRLVGFMHVVFDDDDRWGSLIDNLHITQDRRRTGIGTALLTCAAEADAERATGKSTYLWAFERTPPLSNSTESSAILPSLRRHLHRRRNGAAPGGVPTRLNGSPNRLRFTWPDASLLACTTGHSLSQRIRLRHAPRPRS